MDPLYAPISRSPPRSLQSALQIDHPGECTPTIRLMLPAACVGLRALLPITASHIHISCVSVLTVLMSADQREDLRLLRTYGLDDVGEGVDPYAIRGVEHLSSDLQRLIETFVHRNRPDTNTFGISYVPQDATWGCGTHIDILCIDNDPVSMFVVGRVAAPIESVGSGPDAIQPYVNLQLLRHRDLVAARILQGQHSNPQFVSTQHTMFIHRWRTDPADGRMTDLSGRHTGPHALGTLRRRGLVVGDIILVEVELVRVRVNCLTWLTWTTIFHLGPVFFIDLAV
ncbi:hypothetical protein A0H81_02089 [Grifola frondosa]|uniref:Uncharacterized protein n=1 Tax=Grifola frondosa TaxID=5627 RepID=A0A1C7MKI7_GRIFR|nr:hypothetical protein A0H81_02089 [Grifola frondosa]